MGYSLSALVRTSSARLRRVLSVLLAQLVRRVPTVLPGLLALGLPARLVLLARLGQRALKGLPVLRVPMALPDQRALALPGHKALPELRALLVRRDQRVRLVLPELGLLVPKVLRARIARFPVLLGLLV